MRKFESWVVVLVLAALSGCGESSSQDAASLPVSASPQRGTSAEAAPSPPSGAPTGLMAPSLGGPASASSGMGAAAPSGALPLAPTTPSASSPPPSGPADSPAASDSNPPPLQQSGTLTAGTWDDNRNFDRFMAYRANQQRLGAAGILPLSDAEHNEAHEAFSKLHGAKQTLDVALVIDTTGSMSDEIRYLQTEFLALSRAIEADYPDAQQRWALVVYRDVGDAYVTRWFDFTENLEDFRSKLSEQSADGGGDFPEAPEAALQTMAQMAWRDDDENTARLAFWVADAPHHAERAAAMAEALRATRELKVHVYPVASSGIDEFTELGMRSAAQFTGGRYLFLTNDSGVGGDHKEPSIPCYFVTRLDKAILRMVRIELSGEYSEPASDDIVRKGGNPQAGSCKLESGATVVVF